MPSSWANTWRFVASVYSTGSIIRRLTGLSSLSCVTLNLVMSLTCHINREIYMYLRYVKKDGKKLCPFDLKSLDCIVPDRKVQGANMGQTCVGPMLALWTLLSGITSKLKTTNIYEMKYLPLLIWLVAFRLFSAKLLPNQCSLDS